MKIIKPKHAIVLLIIIISSCSNSTESINESSDKVDSLMNFNLESSEQSEPSDLTYQNKNTVQKGDSSFYGMVSKVVHKDGGALLVIDPIGFYEDDKAYEVAKSRNDLDYHIEPSGDTSFYVLNDYYVENDDLTVIKVIVHPEVVITAFSTDLEDNMMLVDTVGYIGLSVINTKAQFKQIFNFTMKGNRIIRIQERFIP